MKKILFILTTLLLFAGCKKDEKPIDYRATLSGEWHCTPEGLDVDIYATFNEDGTFDLYQKAGAGRYRHYTGSWTCEGNTLSGSYSDGNAWGSSYTMNFTDQDHMTLTALNGSEEVMAYTREPVPSEVKEDCIEAKSEGMLNSHPQYRWL